ncbi:MAG: hypothetical protein P1U56_02770 [Saprospiraceae bacterium]|nr:hypothetical protein [Saprospiraceae bacterium]
MTIYKQMNAGGNNQSPFGGLAAIMMLVVGLFLTYLVVKGIFTILFWLSPILLIAGIAIDPNGALSFGKSLFNISKKNPLLPVIVVVISALWFPVVPGILGALAGVFLLTKAMVKKKIKKVFKQNSPQEQAEEEFTEYEEIKEDESFLELPEMPEKQKDTQRPGNEYDNLFE